MTRDSILATMSEALGLNPFVALAVLLVLGLALAAALALALPRLLDSLADSSLPPRARRQVRQAQAQGKARIKAAQDRPAVWRRQIRAEADIYTGVLRAQLRAENGGR